MIVWIESDSMWDNSKTIASCSMTFQLYSLHTEYISSDFNIVTLMLTKSTPLNGREKVVHLSSCLCFTPLQLFLMQSSGSPPVAGRRSHYWAPDGEMEKMLTQSFKVAE